MKNICMIFGVVLFTQSLSAQNLQPPSETASSSQATTEVQQQNTLTTPAQQPSVQMDLENQISKRKRCPDYMSSELCILKGYEARERPKYNTPHPSGFITPSQQGVPSRSGTFVPYQERSPNSAPTGGTTLKLDEQSNRDVYSAPVIHPAYAPGQAIPNGVILSGAKLDEILIRMQALELRLERLERSKSKTKK